MRQNAHNMPALALSWTFQAHNVYLSSLRNLRGILNRNLISENHMLLLKFFFLDVTLA